MPGTCQRIFEGNPLQVRPSSYLCHLAIFYFNISYHFYRLQSSLGLVSSSDAME